ncbi:MAG: hypothetical protein WB586_27990 [Chthoniobacterales bacterium]
MSWQGIVPDSFRHFREHHPDAELQLKRDGRIAAVYLFFDKLP